MQPNIDYEKCLAFINCQLSPEMGATLVDLPVKPAITLSRMAGAGGRTVAAKLAEYLQDRTPEHCPWTVFDRNLVEQVLKDHHLQKRIADFMPERHKSMLTDIVEEFLELHPSLWTLVEQTAETILRLAQLGYVILVGRGANVITSRLDNVFHVRLVGSLQKRIERVQHVFDLDSVAALDFVKREDAGRRRYLKDHFKKDIDDASLYHLVINTDRTPYEDTARLVGDEVIRRFRLDRHGKVSGA